MITFSRRSLFVALVSLTACTPQPPPPPLFNAVDSSLSCQAGTIGWDFATGGAMGQAVKPVSQAIFVTEASYGKNVGGRVGNWTAFFQAACNDKLSCSRKVTVAGENDPVPGQPKAFSLKYSCGSEGQVYAIELPPDAGQQQVSLSCGPPITIASASYGANCNSANNGNVTNRVIKACAGARNCYLGVSPFAGFDPASGCAKNTTVQYYCGDSTVAQSVTWGENDVKSLSCPPAQTALTGADTITMGEVSWGDFRACPGLYNLMNPTFASQCNGKTSCTVVMPTSTFGTYPTPTQIAFDAAAGSCVFGCPAGAQACLNQRTTGGALSMEYKCGTGPTQTRYIPSDATRATVSISCGPKITIAEASYGNPGNALLTGNFTQRAKILCDGASSCDMSGDAYYRRTGGGWGNDKGNALFGSDPAPGSAKQYSISYRCGDDPTVRLSVFGEADIVSLVCPGMGPPKARSSQIVVRSATYGKNCANVTDNNAYSPLVQSCFGRAVCNGVWNPTADPASGCAKDLDVAYTCGVDPEVNTVHVDAPAEGKPFTLSCAPTIAIESATYGANCTAANPPVVAGNATGMAKNKCDGSAGSCAFVFNYREVGEVAPGCLKDLDFRYTCGFDPAVQTAHVAGEADTKTATLTCPTNAYEAVACVPTRCTGSQRRDRRLNCVTDNTLVKMPPIDRAHYAIPAANRDYSDRQGGVAFLNDSRIDLDVQLDLNAAAPEYLDVMSRPVGSVLGKVTLWATDVFTKGSDLTAQVSGLSLPPDIQGVRCTVGHGEVLLVDSPGGKAAVARFRNLSPLPQCFTQNGLGNDYASFADAAFRLNIDEATFRAVYVRTGWDRGATYDARLHVSFDEQGLTTAFAGGATRSTAVAPNPVGFFYDGAKSAFIDMLSYYQQTEVGVFTPPSSTYPFYFEAGYVEAPIVGFESRAEMLFRAESVSLRSNQMVVSAYSTAGVSPTFDVDFTWSKKFDQPGVNPLSPDVAAIAQGVANMTGRGFGATVELSKDGVNFEPVGGVTFDPAKPHRSFPLNHGKPGGRTDRLNVFVPDTVRRKIIGEWRPAGATSYGLYVRVCLDTDEIFTLFNSRTADWTTPAINGYSAKIAPRCVSTSGLIVNLDMAKRKFNFPSGSANSAQGVGNNAGDGTQSGTSTVVSEQGCGTTGTMPTNPTTGCAQRSAVYRSGVNTGGQVSRSLLTTTQTTSEGDSGSSAHGSANVMGYEIMDMTGTDAGADAEWQHKVAINPNWAAIDDAMELANSASAASPVKPKIDVEHFSSGDAGIGVGIEAKVHFTVGPVPVEVSIAAIAAAGFNLEFAWDDPVVYPCIYGKTTPAANVVECFKAYDTALTQDAALEECRLAGGRLAEAKDQTQLAKLKGAMTGAGPYWIGGQLSYIYPDLLCVGASSILASGCNASSVTNYEWMSSLGTDQTPLKIAVSKGTAAQLYDPVNTAAAIAGPAVPNFGGTTGETPALTTQVPDPAGILMTNTGALSTAVASAPHPYVCAFDPGGNNSKTRHSGAAINLFAAAGVSADVCVPDGTIGLCLGVSLNVIESALTFEFSTIRTNVTDWTTPARLKRVAGVNKSEISGQLAFLTATIAASLHLLFFTLEWEIFHYDGVFKLQSTFLESEQPFPGN